MKKILLALLLLASPAFGASITLSNGASCDYSVITSLPTGNVSVVCAGPIIVPPPNPFPIPSGGGGGGGGAFPSGGSYPGPDMWVQAYERTNTGDMVAGQVISRGFTVPPQDVGKTVEVGISGQNLKVFIDGTEYVGPFIATLGNHSFEIRATATASGSTDLYH